ncbi:hypothetical protein Purlil1_8496 [Purpureocillium lilacinum]|uniref:Uncharacterized protein n=1 Tax=Purpureocillium lilacinum TaxID=33203 RepID=A0ABR0BUR3_PURLI|nr:hypothetical protein Purlil1_8496 [Purpureocillium lilacinum]
MMSKNPFDVFKHDPTEDNLRECFRQGGRVNQFDDEYEQYAVEFAVLQHYNARSDGDAAAMDLWRSMVAVFMEHNAIVEWCSEDESTLNVSETDRLWTRQIVRSELNVLGYGPTFAGQF